MILFSLFFFFFFSSIGNLLNFGPHSHSSKSNFLGLPMDYWVLLLFIMISNKMGLQEWASGLGPDLREAISVILYDHNGYKTESKP